MNPTKEKLLEAMTIIVQSMQMSFDQSKYGRITERLYNNTYRVQIQGDTYTIKSLFSFSVGERVLVLFPCGNKKDLYIYPNKPIGGGGVIETENVYWEMY